MIGIAICTHSNFAEGLKNAVEMIAGKQERFVAINFDGMTELVELGDQIKEATQSYDEGCIYVVDLENATPFNASLMAIAYTENVIISGASLPLVLELIINRSQAPLTPQELATSILDSKEYYISIKTSKEVFGS